MNFRELKVERIRKGITPKQMAEYLGLQFTDTYYKKERGEIKFTPEQIALASQILELSPEKINLIFFDGQLPIGQGEKIR